MLSSKLLATWLVAMSLGFATSAPATAEQKTLIKTYNFPKASVSFGPASYDEFKFVYSLCSSGDFEKTCKVTQESFDAADKSHTCAVTLKATSKDENIDLVQVALLNKNRALLLWKEGPMLKTINLAFDGCKTSGPSFQVKEIEDRTPSSRVIAYKDSYDVFYLNSEVCKKQMCRITFANSGKVLKEATAFGPEFDNPFKFIDAIAPIERQSSAKGLLVKTRDFSEKLAEVLAIDDGEKVLAAATGGQYTISTNGNKIGICWFNLVFTDSSLNSLETFQCKQFDFEGKLEKTELPEACTSSFFGNKREIITFARLNQPEGFILFTIESDVHQSDQNTYHAYRINGEGEKVKSIDIADFKCPKGVENYQPKAFQNKAGRPCVSIVCANNDWWDYYRAIDGFSIGVRCFTDAEL